MSSRGTSRRSVRNTARNRLVSDSDLQLKERHLFQTFSKDFAEDQKEGGEADDEKEGGSENENDLHINLIEPNSPVGSSAKKGFLEM